MRARERELPSPPPFSLTLSLPNTHTHLHTHTHTHSHTHAPRAHTHTTLSGLCGPGCGGRLERLHRRQLHHIKAVRLFIYIYYEYSHSFAILTLYTPTVFTQFRDTHIVHYQQYSHSVSRYSHCTLPTVFTFSFAILTFTLPTK